VNPSHQLSNRRTMRRKKGSFFKPRVSCAFYSLRSLPGAVPLATIMPPFQGFEQRKINAWYSKQNTKYKAKNS
jgi:hypothetical protein